MCNMLVSEEIPHFVLYCPYLDGAHKFALLLWSNNTQPTIYNKFYLHFKLCHVIS